MCIYKLSFGRKCVFTKLVNSYLLPKKMMICAYSYSGSGANIPFLYEVKYILLYSFIYPFKFLIYFSKVFKYEL